MTTRTRTVVFSIAALVAAVARARVVGAAAPDLGPEIDPASVTLYPDQGRFEIKGARLTGLRVLWRSGTRSGEDTCPAVTTESGAKADTCVVAVPKDLAADATFAWAPPAPPAPPAATASAANPTGAQASIAHPAPTPLRPARVVLDRVLPAGAAVDLSGGVGRLGIPHPEALASVDCAPARCEADDGAIVFRAVAGAATTLTLRLRLAPRFLAARGDATDSTVSQAIPVLHCAAAIASGPPLRRAEASRIVVRVDARCGGAARDLRWTVNGELVPIGRVERIESATFVELSAGDIEDAQVTVTATRPEPDGSVIAAVRIDTRAAPQPRAVLDLDGFGKIAFIPTNREAVVHTAPLAEHARLVPLAVEGAYQVRIQAGSARVRGEESAGGYVSLRFGYRLDTLPGPFASTDLAILTEPLQRPIREASVPVTLAVPAAAAPLIELLCADRGDKVKAIVPGVRSEIPFAQRDSCRLVIHRERLKAEDGTQDITVDVTVTRVDDSARPESHVSERMVIHTGAQPRVFWIHGVHAPFDRLTVRVSHMIDEAHDLGGAELYVNLPAAQWSVVAGEGHLRFYATAAIPTGLFRITAPSDVLTLNFGALSRLTWLDGEGHEGIAGFEFGAMGIGLAATPGFPRTLAILAGVGVGVPIGNRGQPSQASVNLHAWIAYELRDAYHLNPLDATSPLASHWSFLFGPSITIGNVGTNL